MDAQAYLMRHGWSGPGNPLNPNRRPGTHGGLGLTRPLLVSRRENKIGIGKTSTKDPTNQWWLRGFEEALRGVGTDGTASPTGVGGLAREENTLTRNGSQLYKFFVRGEVIPGTLSEKKKAVVEGIVMEVLEKVSSKDEGKKEKKRKRDREEDDESRKLRKEKRRSKKQKTDSSESASPIEQDQESRKARKKEKKKEKKSKKEKFNVSTTDEVDSAQSTDSKERKRKKKRDREGNDQDDNANKRAEKHKKKKARITVAEEQPTSDFSAKDTPFVTPIEIEPKKRKSRSKETSDTEEKKEKKDKEKKKRKDKAG